jgi:EpsI family protein
VVENAGADTSMRRDYVDSGGNRAALYIAFYGNVQDAVPHGPTICYPSGGWATRHDEVIALPTLTPGLERLQVQKLLYEKDFSQVAVLYWYAANGEQQAGIQWLRHDSARRRLLGLGGAYVIQVMVSAPVTLSSDSSFSVVERFLRQNLDAIAKHFPPQGKRPKGGSSAPRK